ncbi:putative ABC transport system permease protein [Melissococcus plutonius]|nr:putative ABC transport system permease protein [Melissococcus plutonius]
MILPYIDVNVTYTLPIRDLLIKYIIVFAISFIGVYLSIKKSLKDDYLKYITISE